MADRLLVASRKGFFTVDRNSTGSWAISNVSFFADNCCICMHDPRDGAYYVAIDHGHFGSKLHRSDNRGRTWNEIAVPEYPEPKEGEVTTNPMSQKRIEWKLRMIWELQPGGADQPGRLWCGTLPGGLFKSDDRGQSWQLARDLWYREERKEWFGGGYDEAGIHSVCIDPRHSNNLGVGISCGGYWRSEDDGDTWKISSKGMRADYMPPEKQFEENSQDPHIVKRCHAQPDKLWVQHHNGIFRSTDNGVTWTEMQNVQPSAFGFACAVHPQNGDIAWFVPAQKDEKRAPVDARVVVTRTSDGGKSFDSLRTGLPQEHAYDLTFRHALDVDGAGKTLSFGTTTGSLFISEDGGDSWRTVSTHLPPIYCTRFVKH